MEWRKGDLYDNLAVVGKAFGSARRLELVGLLAQGEHSVEELARAADMGMTTVSAHLQVLKAAQLVITRRQGTRIYYALAGDDVIGLYHSLNQVARTYSANVAQALDAYLNVPGDGTVHEISRDDLTDLLHAKSLRLLDVRPHEEFAAGHIPGAVNAPLGDLQELSSTLPAGATTVTYCRGSFCVLAHDAVRILESAGVTARRLEGGMLEWRVEGRDIEVAQP